MKSFGVGITVATNAVGGVTEINKSGGDVNFIDTTTHDTTGAREFIGGLLDEGTIEISGRYADDDVGQSYLQDNPGATAAVVITFSDTSSIGFNAVIGAVDITNPLDEEVGFSCSLKISGDVTWTASA